MSEIGDVGYWETPTRFVFHEKRTMPNGQVMGSIELGDALFGSPDIDKNSVIEAFINSEAEPQRYEGDMVEVACSRCGQPGLLPAELLRDEPEREAIVVCPQCQETMQN